MPNPNYRPDQPEYYNSTNKLDALNNIVGGNHALRSTEEVKNAFANAENYRAYAISRLPQKASSQEIIDTALEKAPSLRIKTRQQKGRRELSEKARQAIVEAAARKVMGQNGRKVNNRLEAVFYLRGTSNEIKKRNDELEKVIKSTPEERGRLLEERIKNDMELYQRILAGTVTKEELVDNFEQFHMVQDLVTNATNFLSDSVPQEGKEPYIKFSPEIKDILVDMERNSTAVYLFVNKIRIIANPNYEFMDLEQVLDLDKATYDEIDGYAMMDADDLVMEDALLIPGTDRTVKKSRGRDKLMKQISEDFPEEFENAKLDFVGYDGKRHTMQYTTEHKYDTIEENLRQGCVMVTTSHGKQWYHLDNVAGTVRATDSSEMLSSMAASAEGVIKGLKKANRGLFFGSKEYDNVLKGMPEVLNSIKEVGNPPDFKKMDLATAQLQEVLKECEKYLKRKEEDPENPERDFRSIRREMSQREKNRYDAMKETANYCRMQISAYELKKQEIKEEMNANLDHGAQEMEAVDKADSVYGKDATLAASNVGTIADELRADINGSLKRMLEEEFDIDEARETFSNMVLLEVIKRGRSLDGDTLVAGKVEEKLAEKPEQMVRDMRNYPAVKAACADMTWDKLRKFVMNDGAKALADKILGAAKEYNPDAKTNELQMQNEQEMQKQNEQLPQNDELQRNGEKEIKQEGIILQTS